MGNFLRVTVVTMPPLVPSFLTCRTYISLCAGTYLTVAPPITTPTPTPPLHLALPVCLPAFDACARRRVQYIAYTVRLFEV